MTTEASAESGNGTWQVQEAKNRFSEVIDRALHEGPQVVTRHGKPVVQVIAVDDVSAAVGRTHRDDGFLALLLAMPKSGHPDGLPLARRRNRRAPPVLGD